MHVGWWWGQLGLSYSVLRVLEAFSGCVLLLHRLSGCRVVTHSNDGASLALYDDTQYDQSASVQHGGSVRWAKAVLSSELEAAPGGRAFVLWAKPSRSTAIICIFEDRWF
jgi:hypothetical protein